MAKAWILDWIRLNKDLAEVMLAVFIQLPAEAENLAVVPKRVRDIEGSIRPKDVTAQLSEFDMRRNTIRIQRFPQLTPIEGMDMDVIQLLVFCATMKADIPFLVHLERE